MITKLNYKDRTIKSYAIRKLTPFECFRLMGVRDSVIHVMQTTVKSVKKRMMKIFKREELNEDVRINFDDAIAELRAQGIEPKIYHSEVKDIRVIGIRERSGHLLIWNLIEESDYPADAEKSFEELWQLAEDNDAGSNYNYDDFDWAAESVCDNEEYPYIRYTLHKGEGDYIKKEISEGTDDMVVSASQQYKQAGNSIVVDVLAHIYENLIYPPQPKQKLQMSLLDAFFPDQVLPDMPPMPYRDGDVFRILTTFSGYDSQLMAADVLKERHPEFKWTCDGWSDIDKYACQMHDLVFPQFADKALGDITKIDWQAVKASLGGKDVDLFTYSSPCQDISQAGKQMGLKEGSGSRSALLWNVSDAVEVLKPKYLLQENVAALVSEKFMPDFQLWLKRLESLGYVNKWCLINAKDQGVPQNRLRVFCLSMRKDVAFEYQFPEPQPLTKRLEDVLEEEVDEKYFLRDDAVSKFLKANDKDSAVFVQFALPPRHEDAMFLKTFLQHMFDEHSLAWDMPPTRLAEVLNGAGLRYVFNEAYHNWKEQGTFISDEFRQKFEENMNTGNHTQDVLTSSTDGFNSYSELYPVDLDAAIARLESIDPELLTEKGEAKLNYYRYLKSQS